ncbi:DUF1830 domain-containing protein [Scytonema hofmannii]|uniref:DUF1830 domain-containing protein n=1 Tax=Scytonema hofmannii TaxID=34078 RepID=UPI0003466070|nr:DUF1830 domain-containing protein [Scytonema hofmannii]
MLNTSLTIADRIFCYYINVTSHIQVARISNIPGWYARLVPHSTTKVLHGSPLMYLRDPKLYCETLLKYLLS